MKISVENFKSIKKLHDFELKPITILSGVNSSGKSSLIQVLLLLKQTIELDSANTPLLINGPFYSTRNFRALVNNEQEGNKIKVSLIIPQRYFDQLEAPQLTHLFKLKGDYSCRLEVEYDLEETGKQRISISSFFLSFEFSDNEEKWLKIERKHPNKSPIISTNALDFVSINHNDQDDISITYNAIFPHLILIRKEENAPDPSKEEGQIKKITGTVAPIQIEDVRKTVLSFFTNTYYLGPIRHEPQEQFQHNYDVEKNVGPKGQFTAQVFSEWSQETIKYHQLSKDEEGKVSFNAVEEYLEKAAIFWICEVLNIARAIKVKHVEDFYSIILIDDTDTEINMKHVGYGVSQILPIIVQGLIMPGNSLLIIEQPEIHLHPRLQSLLYDFLYSLTLQGKKVLVETHSSHFITRMRRRIAEDETNKMDDQVNLTFIENGVFRTLGVDDFGILDYYPAEFIEPSNEELRAIVKAQTKKRKKRANS